MSSLSVERYKKLTSGYWLSQINREVNEIRPQIYYIHRDVSKMWTADVGAARCDIYLNKYFLHLKKEM